MSEAKAEKEYFAIGLGSNYFHPFGTSAISFEEILAPGSTSTDLDSSGRLKSPNQSTEKSDGEDDSESNAGNSHGGAMDQDVVHDGSHSNKRLDGNDPGVDADAKDGVGDDGKDPHADVDTDANTNTPKANGSAEAPDKGIVSSVANAVNMKMIEHALNLCSTKNNSKENAFVPMNLSNDLAAPPDILDMDERNRLHPPKAFIFSLQSDHNNLNHTSDAKAAKKQGKSFFRFLRRKRKDKERKKGSREKKNGGSEGSTSHSFQRRSQSKGLSPLSSYKSSNTSSTSNQTAIVNELPYGSKTNPVTQLAAGMTHLSFITADQTNIYQSGTLHGITYPQPTLIQPKIPLQCTQIACGRRHTLALFENKVVMSWGSGYFGQLGHGLDKVYAPNPVLIDRLMARYSGGSPVKVIAGGMQSAVIVTNDLDSWNKWEEDRTSKGGSSSNVPARFETRVFRFGSNKYGQCAVEGGKCNAIAYPTPMLDVYNPETSKRVTFVSLALGKLHSLGLAQTGELYSWGSLASGRCGHGEHGTTVTGENGVVMRSAMRMRNGISLPKRIDALRNVRIVQICAGDAHNLALSGSGRVFSWGNNSSGQLGVGHSMHLMSPRLIADLEFGHIVKGFGELSQTAELPLGEEDGSGSTGANVENGSTSPVATRNRLGSALAPIHYPATPQKKATQRGVGATGVDMDPPRIISIHAAGSYSAAVSSIGDVYTWGCGEGNQLGHPMPTPLSTLLPFVETRTAMQRPDSGMRTRDAKSFDSRLNVLLPRRIECLPMLGLRAEHIVTSSNFLVAICSRQERSDSQTWNGERDNEYSMGKTLYELQLERKERGNDRIRLLRGSQKKDGNES
jgi:alpha-tubulin suppressor-like RCC1 family protein